MPRPWVDRLASAAAVATVAVFLGSDLLRAAGWQAATELERLRDWLFPQPAPANEIRNYVEFVSVTDGGIKITTGIEYGSSLDRGINRQWCYAEKAERGIGDTEYQLTLAFKPAALPVIPNLFTDDNLRPFAIDRDGAQALIEQCRFRT